VDSKQGLRPPKGQVVQSVVRAARVAQALIVAPEGARLRDLSEKLGLRKTTVLRLLNTLISLGVARKDGKTGRYRWHPVRLMWLGMPLRDAVPVKEVVDAVLEELVAQTGETAAFALPSLDGRCVLMASAVVSDDPLLTDPREMPDLPMHTMAAGKIFLAALPSQEAEAWMASGLPAITEHTITSRDSLMADLARVASQGYAVSKEECVLGMNSLAVPLGNQSAGVEAALALVGPASRMSEEKMLGLVPHLQAAAQRLSEALASVNLSGAMGAGGPPPQTDNGAQDDPPSRPPFRVL